MTTPTPADIELPALPDSIVSTAPDRIWLDIGEAKDFIKPDDTFTTLMACEATWSEDNATGCGIEYVRADRARTAASCAGWVPIASAPKNRKLIVGYRNEHGNWRTVIGCFYAAGMLEWHDDYGGDEAEEYAPEGWYEKTVTHEVVMPLETDPTHWMPLPAAPGAPATVRAERTDAATAEPTLEDAYAEGRKDEREELMGVAPGPVVLDKTCAACGGSGDHEYLSGGGPDAYEVTGPCTPCGGTGAVAAEPAPVVQPVAAASGYLPESLTLAVDAWFAQNTGLGGCSDKDVSELAAIFYGVTHEGGRESLEDALAVVEPSGPGIHGLNDTYARQVILAAEVRRLQGTIPEGCTPADARVLREANHALAMEVHQLGQALDLLSGLHPGLTIDSDQPMAMAEAIFSSVLAEIKKWRDEAETATGMLVELAQSRAEIARWKIAQAVPAPTAGDAGGADHG